MASTADPAFNIDPTGYGRLVQDGHYADRPSGLWGKFDNVRLAWENQITRFAVSDALRGNLQRVRASGRGLRVVDLGCGTGEGLDLLLRIPDGRTGRTRRLLGGADFDRYHGIDLCPDMVLQAQARFGDLGKVSFAQGNLNDGDACLSGHAGFDLYYNSYGSLSHLEDDGLIDLLAAIARHQPGPCTVVLDVHGQYSPEWPGYWNYSRDRSRTRMQPYNMVWMYPHAERAARLDEQRDYRIRYWGGRELRAAVRGVPAIADRLRQATFTDRSIFVGRHMDTRCFNDEAPPLRRGVNALFEFNSHADPRRLAAPPLPPSGDAEVDAFFATFTRAWNAVIGWFETLLDGDPADPRELCEAGGPVPVALLSGLQSLAAQSRDLGWFEPGDSQANLLQPQFGLLLRQLEYHCQQGLGCGHGLLAVLQLGPAGEGVD